MPLVIPVRVQAISPDRLSLTLATGEQIILPRTPKDTLDQFGIGDEVTLTITRSADLINELLTSDDVDGTEKKENDKTVS
jgi:hypothetical protein